MLIEGLKTTKYWTSATNAGQNCDVQKLYSWCATDESLPLALFSGYMRASSDAAAERCLVFEPAGNNTSTLLSHEGCTDDKKLPYICEPTCKAASCPAACDANVNSSF